MIGSGIILPQPALRRSYFAKLLRADGPFAQLLRELAPERWAAVRARPDVSPMRYFWSLWEHLNTLFPLAELDYEQDLWDAENYDGDDPEQITEEQVAYSALQWGIPIIVSGLSWHDVYAWSGQSPALALVCWLFDKNANARLPKALEPHHNLLERFDGRKLKKAPGAPRGRAFRGRWKALPDLVDYCLGKTGNVFLDEASGDIDEYPWWNVHEIAGLAAQWRRAKPMLAGIEALCKFVDAKPNERLLDLAGALTGDKGALLYVTGPAELGKTLADVFGEEKVSV